MKKTCICDRFGIEYPILQGGMLWIACAELAAAVSNAGGLGIVSPLAGMERGGEPASNLLRQLARIRELTDRPFGVNIPLDLTYSGVLIDLLLRAEVPVVITAAGDPRIYSEVLRSHHIRVVHVVSNVAQARIAEACQVDAVIAQGIEAAAHHGHDELPLFSMIPQLTDAVSTPVIAAGGIVDARGIVAAMVLGAEGVQLGTRFVAACETWAHQNYKRAIVAAGDTDTTVTCRRLLPTRSLKTGFSERLLELENSGASAEELSAFMGYSRARTAQVEGDLENGEAYCGASAGLIREVLPAATIIRQLVDGCSDVFSRLL